MALPQGEDKSDLAAAEAVLLDAYPALLAFFRHHLPSGLVDQAEDFAQDCLLAAWTSLSRGGSGHIDDASRYLLGVARNKCADGFRREARLRKALRDNQNGADFRERVDEITAETRLLEAERAARLRRAVLKLAPAEREILQLRYGEGMTNEAAARRLGLSPREASHLKYRALQRLRFLLRAPR